MKLIIIVVAVSVIAFGMTNLIEWSTEMVSSFYSIGHGFGAYLKNLFS